MLGDPLVYIIVVLLFYSCGIVVAMMNFVKKVIHTLNGLFQKTTFPKRKENSALYKLHYNCLQLFVGTKRK